jgi:hypothetical protein
MKKILITILLIIINFNIFSNDILDELIEKFKKYKYFYIYKYDKNYYLEDKLYLIPIIYDNGVEFNIDNNILGIYIGGNPLGIGVADYKISKKDNRYIIEGIHYFNSKTNDKIKFEFIFNKNILTIVRNNKKTEPTMFYIDINNDFEKRYQSQRKNYLYSLIKNSKNNELEITNNNQIKYNGIIYDYQIEPITLKGGGFYKDKFVLIFGDYKIPIEITNETLRIIKDKKLKEFGPFFSIDNS